ncbi:S53 family peptidase [Streptacidiphilus anmyonensis]|uniref:S53 family peptidase n=1 Tax=Streptacidiphilus anmyonensis TaxID=405782 RepID=UPI0006935D13|nr:S53 family peptidase [Streptacidiphilus anmyonensis]
MRPTVRAGRSGAIAAVLAAATALLSAPAVHAAPAKPAPIRLNAKQLAKLSAKYTARTDGTPGLVAAAAAGVTSSTDPTASASTSTTAANTLNQSTAWESTRGSVDTLALNGTGDWVALSTSGTVTRYDAKGDPVWERSSQSLYSDWQVKPTLWYQSQSFVPVMNEGYNPYEPSSSGTHPFAQGDFNGDGVADIAVAYSVGAAPARPFTSPGSDLNSGTFASVLDGRTGRMLWHKLLPGYVGSMLVQNGKLIVADTTGPDWGDDPVAEQGDSRSQLVAYRFTPGKGGDLTADTAWTYDTNVPWADWTDIEPLTDGRITAGWSDTPFGLGNPRPAAGHVLVVDTADGKALVDTKTPGYPRILHQDPGSDRVLVAEQNDPYDAVRWDLTAIDARTGARAVLAERDNTLPEAFLVNDQAHGKDARYAVAELGINADLSDGQSTVSGWDEKGDTVWSYQTSSTVGNPNAPVLSLNYDPSGHGQVFAAVADNVADSAADPEGVYNTQLLAFDARNGNLTWRRDGDVTGDQTTLYRGGLLAVGLDADAWTVDTANGKASDLPLFGENYSATAVDVNGDGVKDLVVGGQSHGVFALDGRDLKSATPHVLWHSAVSAAVHQVQVAQVADAHGHTATRVVAATSHGFAVLDPGTGKVDADVDTGAFQYGLAVTDGEIVATGATDVAAYSADGTVRWTYRPAGVGDKKVAYSTPATDGKGRLFLEYGGARTAFGAGASDPAPTAVALNSGSGKQLWSEQPSNATVASAAWIEPQAGVYARPGVPGTDGDGVAFAFGGDKPATGAHRVQIVDGASGKVVTEHDSVGSATFQSFAASPTYGLIEMHAFEMTAYPADGSAPYDIHTLPNNQQGVFATTSGGDETFVGAVGGLEQYDQPFPNDGDYLDSTSETFSLYAGTDVATNLTGGKATDIVGLPMDDAAYDLNQNVGGYGSNVIAPDNYPHGVTVQQVTDGAPAASSTAKQATPTPATRTAAQEHDAVLGLSTPDGTAQDHAATASAFKGATLSTAGIIAPPVEVKSTTTVSPDDTTEVTKGYTPQQLQARLGLTGDGTGQTIAIVDAYDYPNAAADLNHFAAHFDLPQTCGSVPAGTDCFDFRQVYAGGSQPAANASWEEEEALDIEWAHSIAPHAKIVLVEAADASAAGLYAAVDRAASLHPAVVSNSWGMPEFSEESFYDDHCKLADSVCTQSTGDDGYPAGYSSTNPYALAIGGTSLQLDANGNTLGETAWRSTGGGLSYFEKRPAYQDGVQNSKYRATPDVSFVADPNTGVAVYTTALGRALWLEVGGTSLSAPSWAAIVADADQLRAAAHKAPLAVAGPDGDTAHTDVYALGSKLNDVTSGSNGACGAECTAGPGYDTVTGLGSPLAGVDTALARLK